MKKFKNWLENHGFFDEDHQFFKGFEITKTSNSLILIFFSKIEIANSLILEYLKNQNQWFFKNSKNHTTQKYTYLISNQSLILDPISWPVWCIQKLILYYLFRFSILFYFSNFTLAAEKKKKKEISTINIGKFFGRFSGLLIIRYWDFLQILLLLLFAKMWENNVLSNVVFCPSTEYS